MRLVLAVQTPFWLPLRTVVFFHLSVLRQSVIKSRSPPTQDTNPPPTPPPHPPTPHTHLHQPQEICRLIMFWLKQVFYIPTAGGDANWMWMVEDGVDGERKVIKCNPSSFVYPCLFYTNPRVVGTCQSDRFAGFLYLGNNKCCCVFDYFLF